MRLKHKGFISINLAIYVLVRMMRLLENLGIIDIVIKVMFCVGATADFLVEPLEINKEQKVANLRKLLLGESVDLPTTQID
jgi:hypothetical protein